MSLVVDLWISRAHAGTQDAGNPAGTPRYVCRCKVDAPRQRGSGVAECKVRVIGRYVVDGEVCRGGVNAPWPLVERPLMPDTLFGPRRPFLPFAFGDVETREEESHQLHLLGSRPADI